MVNRGNRISDIIYFIEMIENTLESYPNFLEWKNDPMRELGPTSIVECMNYAFKIKSMC